MTMVFDLQSLHYLPLLLMLPCFWWLGRGLFRSLGRGRAVMACALRSVVLVSLVLALSELQFGWFTDRVAVVYVLDQSDSVDVDQQRVMNQYVQASSQRDRDARRRDLAGMVRFAGRAQIEVPPFEDRLPSDQQATWSDLDVEATNVEEAIDLAVAAMPPDTRQRIVLITDGNETTGSATRATVHAAGRGVGIDIVPVICKQAGDVSLERLDLPEQVNAGQPFSGRLVVSYQNHSDQNAIVRGQIVITQSTLGEEQLVLSETVRLSPGKTVLPFQHQLQTPAAYSWVATFVPEQPDQDRHAKNNRVSAFTQVGGVSRTLLIEPATGNGEFALLARMLREEKIDVDVRSSDVAFHSLGDLLAYDSVILANIPRAGGDSLESMAGLTDAQSEILVRNTQQFGAGLLMIGGLDAFGAGGWGGTTLEAAMPVDFDVKNTKIRAVGALSLVLDTSGSMSGQKLQLCKAAAREAILSLGETDYVGVISFSGETQETIPLQRVEDPRRMLPAISRIAAGGGTVMYPAISLGYQQLARADAMVKHMIVITDGRTQPGRFDELVRAMRRDGITVSTLAIGGDADVPLLQGIATQGGGKFYRVMSPQAIPRIVLRESRRVSKPLIYETEDGVLPQQAFPHAVVEGIRDFPPVRGFILTTPKQSPLVQNILLSPQPGDFEHPLLSVWTYGLGHTAVLTTDAGQRWADAWSQWQHQQQFFAQLVRWLKRPSGGGDTFQVTSRWSDGEIRVVVNTINEEQEALRWTEFPATVVGPSLETASIQLRKVAPGRYVGTLAAEKPGSYFIQARPGAEFASIVTGVTVPFGQEYRSHASNLGLLESLANIQTSGGSAGLLTEPLEVISDDPTATNHFREGLPKRPAWHPMWPWLVLIGCLVFLGDVGNRRLSVNLPRLLQTWRQQAVSAPATIARLDRLEQLQSAKTMAKSTSVANAPLPPINATASPSRETEVSSLPDQSLPSQPSYTQRLLEAKRRAQKVRGGGDDHV